MTVVVGTGSPDGGDDSADGDPVTFEEVGRASFTHTIVGGDFLRSIADTYDVEIDDIVAANRWQDGREHLLLPGDEIELQADAVEPPETTDSTVYQTEERADGDVEQVCSGGQMLHSLERHTRGSRQSSWCCRCFDRSIMGTYTVQAGDPFDGLESSLGAPSGELHYENTDTVNTVPEGEWAELTPGQTLNVCMTWFE